MAFLLSVKMETGSGGAALSSGPSLVYLNLTANQMTNFVNSSSIRSFFISISPPFDVYIIGYTTYKHKGFT